MPAGRRDGRAVVVYTAARIGLFLGCLTVGWFAGLGGAALLITALLASGVLSWFLLRRQRLAMGNVVERRMARMQSRFDQRAAAEDAYVDALHGAPAQDRDR